MTWRGDKPSRALPRSIWALGFVSLFMDISSEMIHGILPVFLVGVLGASALALGLIEGIAEATASIVKIFSGTLSDYLGRRKLLAVAGYGLSALTKPLFPLAGSASWVFAARFADRIGKGIRGAPRDALVGDLAPPELRGAAYGLRQSLDTVGAFIGPLLAVALMWLFAGDVIAVLWVAVIPAFVCVAILLVGVRDAPPAGEHSASSPIAFADIRHMGRNFWWLILVATLLSTARFSEAFVLLRLSNVGIAFAFVPLGLVVMNLFYSATAYPAGSLSDRLGRTGLLAWGIAILVAANILLAATDTVLSAFAGIALWGVHLGLTQGLLAALVTDHAPIALRGTAFGLFHLVTGIALLAASLIAGLLWDTFGPWATFAAGASMGTVALGSLVLRPIRAE